MLLHVVVRRLLSETTPLVACVRDLDLHGFQFRCKGLCGKARQPCLRRFPTSLNGTIAQAIYGFSSQLALSYVIGWPSTSGLVRLLGHLQGSLYDGILVLE